jgi:hypothetical protein
VGLVAAWLAPVGAHELPAEVLAYVKAEGETLRVLVRVPVAFLSDAGLPVRADGYLDLQGLERDQAVLAAVASDVARNLDVMEDDRVLPSPRMTWRISQAPDAAFDTYDDAMAVLVSPRFPVDARIDPGRMLLDLEFEYPIRSPKGLVSVRMNGLRAGNRPSRMQTRYETPEETRTFITTGEPRRVTLEPRWQAVGSMFARLGFEQLTVTAVHLLFIMCLAIPRRSMSAALAVFGSFVAGGSIALALSALAPGPSDPASAAVLHSLAAAALVVAALQNITAPRFEWVRIVAAAFGLLDGLVLGVAYHQHAPLAGSHAVVSVAAFVSPILIGWVWLLLVARPAVGLVYRTGLPERWATVFLSAVPIHAGLHGLLAGR